MGKQSEKGILVQQYCKSFPDLPDLTLARKICEENKDLFPEGVEKVRSNYVRPYRGHQGNAKKGRYETEKPVTYDTRNYKEQLKTPAKILILDIETAPIMAYVWGVWQQNIQPSQIEQDWFCLTWAAKWLFEDKVYSGKLTAKEAKVGNDRRIIKGIWELINEADIVIAHNGQKFDMPKLNSRFVLAGLEPPLPYIIIDTLLHIRKQFGFSHNKLDYVNQLLGLPRKQENEGMPLWIRCLNGDGAALKEMEEYNIQDVRILEGTYLAIRPWIKPHPNLGLHILDEKAHRCPTCGSDDLKEEGKHYHTTVNTYEMFRCNNCKATGRKRVAKPSVSERRYLLSSIPK